jgi:hypothetical protein
MDVMIEPPGGTRHGRVPRVVIDRPGRADRIFQRLTLSSGLLVLILLTLVGVFLLWQSRHALSESGWSFFTRVSWNTTSHPARIGVLGLVVGTVLVALVAVVIAIPLGVCAALFITEYASPGLRKILQSLIDLLAAEPEHPLRALGIPVPVTQGGTAVAVDQSALLLHPVSAGQAQREPERLDVHRRDRRIADGAADRRLDRP